MIDASEQDSHWRVIKIGPDQAILNASQGKYLSYIEQWRKLYPTFKDMPTKTQEAIAALSMCPEKGRIAGLGMRVSATTFWIDDDDALLKEYEDE